jgi:hypothetical protein
VRLKIKYTVLVWFFLTISVSCNNGLDILPLNILTSQQIFESKSGITAYLATLYNNLPVQDFRYRNYGADLANYTDEALTSSSAEVTAIPNGTSMGVWPYQWIRGVNILIENTPGANLSDKEKGELIGEAKFLRAFYYFGLVKMHGGVPIIDKVQNFTGDNLQDLQVPRNSEKGVYDFIAADLDEAISALPESSVPGKANKYTALALKSRAMLYAASIAKSGTVMLDGILGIPKADAAQYWQKAYDASKQIVDSKKYTLYAKNANKELNFTELFIDQSNPEAIFSIQFKYPDKGHVYDRNNLPFSIRAPSGYGAGVGPYLDLVEEFEYVDGTDGKLKTTNADGSPIYYKQATDIFLNKDPRCLATVIAPFSTFRGNVIDVQAGIYDQGVKWEAGDETSLYNPETHQPDKEKGTLRIVGVNGFGSGSTEKTQTGFYLRKYLNYTMDQSRANVSDQAWIEFRLGEVLLNYAEAAFELNKTADATVAINLIRERAGIKLLTESETTLEKIRHERLVELAFENHRWFDYRRWRIADQVLSNSRFSALKPYWDIQQKAYRFEKVLAGRYFKTFDFRAYYERIDPAEISKNPKMVQNPGY